MIINLENLSAAFIAFSTGWQDAYDQTPVWSDQVATEAPSSTESNSYLWMSQMPRMRKWLGERQVQHFAGYKYSLTNDDWELTCAVPRNKFDDDQYGTFVPIIRDQGAAAKKWADDMLLEVILAAESSLCFDGQYFFDSDHPVDMFDAAKGSYSNLITSFALTAENYADARRRMRLFKGDNGRPLGVRPDLLMVPPQLEDRAKRILESDTLALATLEGQTQVGANENIYKGTARILVVDELGDYPNDWYLLCTNRAVKPFVVQKRKAPAFQQFFNLTDPNVFFHKEYKFGCDARGAAGYTLPFLAMKCKG